jgi:hypothetical protein
MKIILLFAAITVGAVAQSPAPNDYSNPKSWLCRPDAPGVCDTDLTTTVIQPGGKLTRETWTADKNAPIDCFYVYPTVSTDPTPNSDMTPDPAELNVIRQQFARFGSKCRTYALMYRQITLVGLRAVLAGGSSLERGLQYDDVRDAWNYYLEHDNKGRGFVLIGHSQGSFILAELIRREIEGKAVQSRMISAILPGTTVAVPRGKDVGGGFQNVPVCHSAKQTGCVIVYASYRSTVPPPATTLFGRAAGSDKEAACANPAALDGGSGELHAYFSVQGSMIAGATTTTDWAPGTKIETPWVSVPGMVTARCTSNDNATYLELTVHSDPSGKRANDIPGDLSANGQVQANWGLHLVDMNVAIGNLLDIVEQQGKAWTAQPK